MQTNTHLSSRTIVFGALLGNQLMLSIQCKWKCGMCFTTESHVVKAEVMLLLDVWPYSCVCMGVTRWLCEQQINSILLFPQSFLCIPLCTSGCWSSKKLCSEQHRHTRGQFTTLIPFNKVSLQWEIRRYLEEWVYLFWKLIKWIHTSCYGT